MSSSQSKPVVTPKSAIGLRGVPLPGLHERLAQSHPSLTRGQVWCRSCGATQKVNSAGAMRFGWPKCCGYTMT